MQCLRSEGFENKKHVTIKELLLVEKNIMVGSKYYLNCFENLPDRLEMGLII